MKKQFKLEIAEPCNEDFSKMKKNNQGFFCNSCVKTVIDLSNKTDYQIAQFIANNKDKHLCARLKTSQLNTTFEHNEFQKANNFKSAMAIAATVLLTASSAAQEKEPVKTEINCPKPNPHTLGKVAYNQIVEKNISFIIKGKVLDSKTNKPLSKTTYPNLILSINGVGSDVKINSETGIFSIPIQISENNKELIINLNSNDSYYSKTLKINTSSIKNGVLLQNILVETEAFSKIHIAGGLGVIIVPKQNPDEFIMGDTAIIK